MAEFSEEARGKANRFNPFPPERMPRRGGAWELDCFIEGDLSKLKHAHRGPARGHPSSTFKIGGILPKHFRGL